MGIFFLGQTIQSIKLTHTIAMHSHRIVWIFQVLPGQTLAQAIAGLLFAVHPIHSEAVAGIVGRADLLACLFAEGAFLAYVAHYEQSRPILHLLLTLLFSVLATLAKETGISSLALCLLWDFSHSEALLRKVRRRLSVSVMCAPGVRGLLATSDPVRLVVCVCRGLMLGGRWD